MRQAGVVAGMLAAMMLSAATGCRFDKKSSSGDRKSIRLATPFGGLNVRTDEDALQDGVGLTVYPGATLERGQKDGRGSGHGDGAASVNLNFGSFRFGVKVLSYTSPDAPEKVLAFYRKDLSQYGLVIHCVGAQPVGVPARTQDGLGCDTDRQGTIDASGEHAEELKAGSRQHQHMVVVQPQAGGSRLKLVALDLPGTLTGGDDRKD